ncbi:hypothetical protein CHELA1G11_13286 [Hyphomicrobiales bacterium]|nr:hypothetical protein CHELA1G2_11028 [Hyphomicrobiales bacterium]CAH1670608.1 hypothetical protein CHELA1G11_13286 [Hyphomicrobiales bacterium]
MWERLTGWCEVPASRRRRRHRDLNFGSYSRPKGWGDQSIAGLQIGPKRQLGYRARVFRVMNDGAAQKRCRVRDEMKGEESDVRQRHLAPLGAQGKLGSRCSRSGGNAGLRRSAMEEVCRHEA